MHLLPYISRYRYLLTSTEILSLWNVNGTEMGWDRNGHGTEAAGPKCPASALNGLVCTYLLPLYEVFVHNFENYEDIFSKFQISLLFCYVTRSWKVLWVATASKKYTRKRDLWKKYRRGHKKEIRTQRILICSRISRHLEWH